MIIITINKNKNCTALTIRYTPTTGSLDFNRCDFYSTSRPTDNPISVYFLDKYRTRVISVGSDLSTTMISPANYRSAISIADKPASSSHIRAIVVVCQNLIGPQRVTVFVEFSKEDRTT